MQQLEKSIELRGLGSKVISKEIVRQGNIALYQRTDGVYEVFIVKIAKAQNLFGKQYLERETYPSNEDFGSSAWCYSSRLDLATKKFNSLLQDQTA